MRPKDSNGCTESSGCVQRTVMDGPRVVGASNDSNGWIDSSRCVQRTVMDVPKVVDASKGQ